MFTPPLFFRSITYFAMSLLMNIAIASAALKVGDPTPSLASAKWVRGEPVQKFEGDKVYIVEFWATWCGPCIQAIPHLNDLYDKYKDRGLVVIGHNLNEDEAIIKPFLSKMGGKMSYSVTCDDGSNRMSKQWLEAAGQSGIPCGFVIDKSGKIAYIGHPMSLDESLLTKLLAAPSTKPTSTTPAAIKAPAKPSAEAVDLAKKITVALSANKLDEAEAMAASLHEQIPDALRHMAGTFDMEILIARGSINDASQLATMMAEDFAPQPEIVNQIAERLVASPSPAAELLATAEKIATPQTRSENCSAAWKTLARVATLRGEKDKAAEYQLKANQTPAKAAGNLSQP
jgi:thiol-disulfide isomerase/thioredoxin